MRQHAGHGKVDMEDLRRFDEVADWNYSCERRLRFLKGSADGEKVHERGDCLFAPKFIKQGENLVRIVGKETVWRFHPECVYEHLRDVEAG